MRILNISNTGQNPHILLEELVPGEYPEDASIATHHDTIPNFAVDPDIVSVKSGPWSSGTTWSLGRVPAAGEVVGIASPHTVTYSNNDTTAYKAVGIAGTLRFSTSTSTKLHFQHLLIYGLPLDLTGHLEIGTELSPVQAGVTAELVVSDVALESSDDDPKQYGNGLLCWGRWVMCGQSKTPYARTSVEPAATDSAFTLASAATNWSAGEEVVIPDSRQLNGTGERWSNYSPKWEHRTIDSMAGGNTTVNLSSALTYDHPGGESDYGPGEGTGAADFLPHVGNLTRNVIIRSEDGTGVRGHIMTLNRADRDTRWYRIKEMGRTTNGTLSSYYNTTGGFFSVSNTSPIAVNSFGDVLPHITGEQVTISGVTGNTAANGTWTITATGDPYIFTLDGSTGNGTYNAGTGSATHLPSNQIGRYADHIHHCYGPVSTPANGYQLTNIGFVIDDPLPASATIPASKWGLTLHNSDYGLYQDGIVHHYAGANVMTEDGSESYNVFERILSMNNIGDINPRDIDGRSGAGFFFAGFNNYFRDCVCAGNTGTNFGIVSGSGFEYADSAGSHNLRIPLYKGADTHDGDEGVEFDTIGSKLIPILECARIECYGAGAGGFVCWNLGTTGYENTYGIGPSLMEDIKVWNVWEYGFFNYPTKNYTLDGFTLRCAASFQDPDGSIGMFWGDYWAGGDTLLTNGDVRGCRTGLRVGHSVHGDFVISNSYFLCTVTGVTVLTPSTPGTAAGCEDHTITIDNCLMEQLNSEVGYFDIEMEYTGSSYLYTNLRVSQVVNVTDHQQVPGDDFRLYFEEQEADFEMPQTGGNISVACPEAGLTNAEAYVAYNQDGTAKVGGSLADPTGCCIAGAIAPGSATTRASIEGLIEEV
jgi:hypothetical protein